MDCIMSGVVSTKSNILFKAWCLNIARIQVGHRYKETNKCADAIG